MPRHDALNAASLNGSAPETPLSRPSLATQIPGHHVSPAFTQQPANVLAEQNVKQNAQAEDLEQVSPMLAPGLLSAMGRVRNTEESTLEDHARAIECYRHEYEMACAEASYDAAAEQAYREHCAQRAPLRDHPTQAMPLIRCLGIRSEYDSKGPTRLQGWRKPLKLGVPLIERRKVSTRTKIFAVAFVGVFTLAITPMLHACMFSLHSPDVINWILSAECSAYLAAMIAWAIMGGRSARRRHLGVVAGLVLALGLGAARFFPLHAAGKPVLTVDLAAVATVAVLLLGWRAAKRSCFASVSGGARQLLR